MNSLNRWVTPAIPVIGICILLTGCGTAKGLSASNSPASSGHSAHGAPSNPQAKSSPVHGVLLARSSIPGRPGQELELVDAQGQYTDNRSLGPFHGPNWTGHFQLRVVNRAGKVLSSIALPDNKYTRTLFMRRFQFHFADYNGAGNPDFALGQYFDSNGYVYSLFAVAPKGLSRLRIVPAQLFVADSSYSPLFQTVSPNGFSVKFYDNAKAKWFRATYVWKGGQFVHEDVKVIRQH